MDREELLRSPDYHMAGFQMELYRMVFHYMRDNRLTEPEMAKYLGISETFMTKLMNAEYRPSLYQYISIISKCGYAPLLGIVKVEDYDKEIQERYVV